MLDYIHTNTFELDYHANEYRLFSRFYSVNTCILKDTVEQVRFLAALKPDSHKQEMVSRRASR